MNIDYGMTKNYRHNWDCIDAVRELVQNCIDNKECTSTYEIYVADEDYHHVYITTKNYVLPMEAFALGTSAKTSRDIGGFGEGFKLALMILAREGLNPVVGFGPCTAKCKFTMNGLLGKVNVFNSTVLPIPETVDILEDQPGVIMVCGLFVCEDKKFKYGYNFAADKLELGCDRQIASSFGMAWETSRVWAERLNDGLDADKVLEMAENNDMDVSDLHFFLNNDGANALEALYIEQHGDVPVHTIGQSAEGRAVSHTFYSSLAIAGRLTIPLAKVESVPHKELRLFFEAEKKHMRRHAKVQFDKLLKKSEDWRN